MCVKWENRCTRLSGIGRGIGGMLTLLVGVFTVFTASATNAHATVSHGGVASESEGSLHGVTDLYGTAAWSWVWVGAAIVALLAGACFFILAMRWDKQAKESGVDGVDVTADDVCSMRTRLSFAFVMAAVPLAIFALAFLFTRQGDESLPRHSRLPAVIVDVSAFEQGWKFGYAEVASCLSPTDKDYDGEDLAMQERFDSGELNLQELGLTPLGGAANSPGAVRFNQVETIGKPNEVPVLVLPAHSGVEFRMASRQIANSFWIPDFVFAGDPDHGNQSSAGGDLLLELDPVVDEGTYVGRCSDSCGSHREMMTFELRIVSPEDFRSYMGYRMEHPEASNADALRSISQPPYAVSSKPAEGAPAPMDMGLTKQPEK